MDKTVKNVSLSLPEVTDNHLNLAKLGLAAVAMVLVYKMKNKSEV